MNASASILRNGSQSKEVQKVQVALQRLGYFNYPKATGYYGRITVAAVKRFQKKYGLMADGIVGNRTKRVLLKNTQKVENISG
jgi:peptidoglycan hydrolase-like protein with peptidoglycan-binding domain